MSRIMYKFIIYIDKKKKNKSISKLVVEIPKCQTKMENSAKTFTGLFYQCSYSLLFQYSFVLLTSL